MPTPEDQIKVVVRNDAYQRLIDRLKTQDFEKYQLLTNNEVFRYLDINDEEIRVKLPHLKAEGEKVNIMSILKDAIGKDITRFSVPVQLNEPITMLQRFCEQFEYTHLLDTANQLDDSCLKMAYIMAFGLTPLSCTIHRCRKPANPLLGETFEYINQQKGYRLISEQVSHHPPISAGYCFSDSFHYWSNTNVKSTFWGNSMEFKPLGLCNIILTKNYDHFIWTKCITSGQNLIFGKMYLENHGEMNYTNLKTNETGVLRLKKRGWNNKGKYQTTGEVRDKDGVVKYTVSAMWNKDFTITNVKTGEKTTIWQRDMDFPKNNQMMYYFTRHDMLLPQNVDFTLVFDQ